MGFAKFMSSGLGRGLRIVVGLALIVIGLFSYGGSSNGIIDSAGRQNQSPSDIHIRWAFRFPTQRYAAPEGCIDR